MIDINLLLTGQYGRFFQHALEFLAESLRNGKILEPKSIHATGTDNRILAIVVLPLVEPICIVGKQITGINEWLYVGYLAGIIKNVPWLDLGIRMRQRGFDVDAGNRFGNFHVWLLLASFPRRKAKPKGFPDLAHGLATNLLGV